MKTKAAARARIRSVASESPASSNGKAVTSYDVAKCAGVSQSAVSRCFTQGGSVSKATRAKIMAAVDELGYRPNAIARSLITQRSNMVAIIIANIGFHPEFTASLSRSFARRGLHVLLFTLDHEADADRVVDQIWQYRVDGVVAAVSLPRSHIETFAKRKMPLVFLNRYASDIPINSVCCDQAEAERVLVERLLAAGHRRFGVIAGPADSAISLQRVEEAVKRLSQDGVDDIRMAEGAFDYESGRQAMRELAEPPGGAPEAVICANDMMALGAMDAVRFDLGLTVPRDVSVVGFDGLSQAYWASYDLVTIRQPVTEMVEAAVDMLLARVDNADLATEKRMFSGHLVRGSSAKIG